LITPLRRQQVVIFPHQFKRYSHHTLPLPVLTEQQEIVRLIEKGFLWIDRLTTETTNAAN